jgi:hypothetical protein
MKVKYPIGPAEVIELEDEAEITVEISGTNTVLKAAAGFSQAVTGLNLVAHPDLPDNSEVQIDIQQLDGEDEGVDVAFGSDGNAIVAPDLVGVDGDRDVITLRFDKTENKFVGLTVWSKLIVA